MAAYIQGLSPLVGAWLGAVVIPLDWERPWQQWPISCVLGAVVGQAIGSVATAVLYYMPTTVENDDRKTQ
jgi:phosphatidylinositol glycan class F